MIDRAQMAASYLATLIAEKDGGKVRQTYQAWLYYATAGEIRKHWRSWMGAFPEWAKK